jgi:hypothetical protein
MWHRNRYLTIGIIGGCLFTSLLVYPEFMWDALQTGYVPPLMWLIPIGCGVFNFSYAVVRMLVKMHIRRIRDPQLEPLKLDMHPTTYTTV